MFVAEREWRGEEVVAGLASLSLGNVNDSDDEGFTNNNQYQDILSALTFQS